MDTSTINVKPGITYKTKITEVIHSNAPNNVLIQEDKKYVHFKNISTGEIEGPWFCLQPMLKIEPINIMQLRDCGLKGKLQRKRTVDSTIMTRIENLTTIIKDDTKDTSSN